jgi:hypothetical protein
MVETVLTDHAFIPNDVHLGGVDGEARCFVVTGCVSLSCGELSRCQRAMCLCCTAGLECRPNMGGKSVYVKMAATLVVMAHIGRSASRPAVAIASPPVVVVARRLRVAVSCLRRRLLLESWMQCLPAWVKRRDSCWAHPRSWHVCVRASPRGLWRSP